ncbi:gpW family head-tail joining protein [Commensalibacter oyaizuii]|uniref:GpW family head-tail joining protein n=1 Tax=Commensalibacter oyaizuii TaxID=3043873 RepID=A0ABT6Q3B9_9PROT|nr:gpW family head-tail joining protein [Commensalibacter sp. TBRC 16381]MDI2091612.1 gpW family head-tail joining protein [Commensalibacter sp. TBRC 16381]
MLYLAPKTMWSNLSRETLQSYLSQAQQAYNNLMLGNKPISVSYSQETGAKSVTYTQANMQLLQGYILDLQRALGINRRRAIGVRFR